MTDTNNSNERLANDPHCDSIANGSVSHSHSLSSHRQSTGIYFGNASAGSGGGNARIQDLSTDASSESSTSQGWSYLSSPDEHHSNVDLADAEVDGLGIAMEGLSLYSPPVAGPLATPLNNDDDDEESDEESEEESGAELALLPEFLSPYDQYLSDEDGGTPGSGISNSVDEVDRNARSADAGIVAQDTDEGSMHPPVDEVAFNIENADPEISEVRSPKKVPPTESNVSGRQYQVAELTATAGPHAGGSWIVQKGDREKYCIGRDPKRKGYLPIKLPDDKCIQGTHSYLKLELSKSKLCIRLWDLSNGKIETSGTRKDVGIYILSDKDFIAMGGTRLVVSHVPCRSLN